ncbi:sigma-54 dependent transcriptional regulator [Alphaproteobacteria bacterium]|nr:sigma-54 dependent transcriptional regulator [Alphaproteobacteria bacterium]
MNKNILIIDDDFSLRRVMEKALKNSKTNIKSVSTISEAWVDIEKNRFDLIICDVVLPDGDGLELVKKVKSKDNSQSFIIISAKNNLLTAIKANQLDVVDYLPKPLDLNDLTITVDRCLKNQMIKSKEFVIDEKLPIIGTSSVMQSVFKNIAKITKTNYTVLITGESGSGKELVAKVIHDYSSRSNSPFIPINMASLPKDLIESELFGYEKGSFTGAEKRTFGFFEKANGGTLFLDEIGDMPIDVQARLLRVLQFGEFSRVGGREVIRTNVRIISATNKNLLNSIDQNLFRQDLFYRLNVINIDLPPLRDRGDDIVDIAKNFLVNFSNNEKSLDSNGIEFLKNHSWPGNIRELENLFKRVCALSTERIITGEILSEFLDKKETHINNHKVQDVSEKSYSSLNVFLQEFLDQLFDTLENESEIQLFEKFISEVEKQLISKTLKYYSGNQIKSSKLLGINRNTLRSKMQKYKIATK